ncbi:MAG TPA: carboxylating nicotinate-nucleotide diphosphorylase [Candidatus Humimicrobiaceae bacterium]
MNNKKPGKIKKFEILELIRASIQEDLGGYGDISSKYLIPQEHKSSAYILCKEKEATVLSGIDVVGFIFEEVDSLITYEKMFEDGQVVKYPDIVCRVTGPSQSLLACERTCLNFLQHLSGIATFTAKFAEIASRYDVKVTDTRKTKPMLRKLEKYAVLCGGGFNHRFGLFDGVMLKDNHIAAAGGIRNAIESVRNNIPHGMKIEVEVKNFAELDDAVESRAGIIMLDNMKPKDIKEAVKIIRDRDKSTIIEASGGISLSNFEDYCRTGVDLISLGCLTHSAPAADFSMDFE